VVVMVWQQQQQQQQQQDGVPVHSGLLVLLTHFL
jgi:hypothetical protein